METKYSSALVSYEKSIHTAINREWTAFKKIFADPTAKQVADFAKHIAEKYAKYEL